IDVPRDAKWLRRIRRASSTGRIPGHHGELVRQVVNLPPPRRQPIADITMQQHERRPNPFTLIRNAEPPTFDVLHCSPRNTACPLRRTIATASRAQNDAPQVSPKAGSARRVRRAGTFPNLVTLVSASGTRPTLRSGAAIVPSVRSRFRSLLPKSY